MHKKIIVCLIGFLTVLSVKADWLLDNESSRLTFVSTKALHVAETGQFTYLSGYIDESGTATLIIDLNSVDTLNSIRDVRMQQWLFETESFPQATFTTNIDLDLITDLAVTDSIDYPLSGELALHGNQAIINTTVRITKVSDTDLIVTTLQPIIIQAEQFDLLTGIDALRDMMGLEHISYAVPVTFLLNYKKNN